MVEFIRIQYRLGRLTAEQVRSMDYSYVTGQIGRKGSQL